MLWWCQVAAHGRRWKRAGAAVGLARGGSLMEGPRRAEAFTAGEDAPGSVTSLSYN